MKRLLALALTFVLLLSLTACGGKKTEQTPDTKEPKAKSYAGMTAAFVGDSITNGAELQKGDKIYWELVSEQLQLGQVTGLGVNGSCYSTKSEFGLEHGPLPTRYQQIPQADLIFIALGCNDFGRSTPMGQIEDHEDVSFYGAINFILDELETQCPDSQIILLTPIPRPNKVSNNHGLKLRDYADAILAVGQARGIPVVDLLTLTGSTITEGVLTDGVHPDKYGHQIMAGSLAGWLLENVETYGK